MTPSRSALQRPKRDFAARNARGREGDALEPLNLRQAQYLRFCAERSPDRVFWTRKGKRLGPAEGDPPAEATHLLAYRIGDGAGAMKGEASDRRTLAISDLIGLGPCFAEPWRTLNAHGLALAGQRAEKRPHTISLRCTDEEVAALAEAADAEGDAHASQTVRRAVAHYLANRRVVFTRNAYSQPATLPSLRSMEGDKVQRVWEGVKVAAGQSVLEALGIRTPSPPGRRRADLAPEELHGMAALHLIGGCMSVTDAWDKPIAFARLTLSTLDGQPFEAFTDETYTATVGPYVEADAKGVFPNAHAPDGVVLRALVSRPDGTPVLRFTLVPGQGYSLGERP